MCPSNTETTAVKNLRVRELELVTVFVLYCNVLRWRCPLNTVEPEGFAHAAAGHDFLAIRIHRLRPEARRCCARHNLFFYLLLSSEIDCRPQDHHLPDADMPRASLRREVSKTTQAWGSTRAAWCYARQ